MTTKVIMTEKRFIIMNLAIMAIISGNEEDFHMHLNRLMTEEVGEIERVED